MQTQIISKKTLNNTITSESNIIKIVEDSVVMIDVAPEDVQELIVNDNQVIIKLNNGETITLENFNYETSDLVFRNQNSEMFVLDFKNVEYNPLESIEALLEGGAGTGATILNNWLAGGALALGAVGVGVAVFDAANGSSDTKQPSKDLSKLVDAINDAKNSLNQLDGDEKQRVENAINDAEAVLKDPESSQELLDQTADDLISIVEDALKDQEAKDAAKLEEAINNLEADLENAKDKLENEDPNDPYTDETKSELEKEIEEAQKLVDDFNNNIGDKPSIDDVNNARDELNNAVDNLKTESQQEFENMPATEADLVALETKANELQKKLDDNAELEESARYTDETRDALQQEINEALQLVADGRDPAKTVTKGDVIKATDELDAADAALKTNAQQEFEDSLATEADLTALETKANELQKKLDDNAKLEESARYTDETRDALQQEINEALQLVADGRDPSKNVTKEEVKKASDELDAADAALKTNAQQEFEDSLATEADLVALETKANELQKKLDDNAKLEESARYTDETRDALQQEINEALQLVADGRDPSKNVTKEEVKKASDELDAADAALKTNAQQEFEDSLATEADLVALETKANELQKKIDDNAELEESARYTDETRDALQQEINEALQLVADGRDPAKTVTKGDVIKATDELDAADAALKTNAQQEFEDSLATEADLVALETKANELQKKLDDNAELEESARYTDETRDALQQEINEALQLVADGRDPAKTVTKGDVIKATDELDAADAALKTNAQQEFEDSLATEADLVALETKANELQKKLDDNAELEESARYTDETRDALQQEINEALQLVADGRDPAKTVTKGDVIKASDELDAADAALKTNAQQEFEDSLATEADLTALETKANELQKKLDDNAELEESARYTDETRDALQQEINEALQLVADGRDPSKNVTKEEVKKASDELDAANAALKTNAQQEFEDSLATEADLTALETKANELQKKLDDNAELEESARYTDETRDALQQEINEALQLVADGRDPSKNVTKGEVLTAIEELNAAEQALEINGLPQEIVLPADNSVNFIPEVINPTTKLPSAEQQLEDKTAFAVASVGLGAVLEANVLTEVLQNSLTVDVADGTVRNLTLKSQSGGVSIVSMYDLKIYQFDEETGQYKEYMTEKQWLKAYLLAGVSEELNVSLPEGKYIVFLTPSVGVTVLSGYTLKVLNDIILDYNEVVSVDGEATGNVITDADAVDGQDVLPTGTIVESVMAGTNAAITLNSNSETAIEGKFGTLFINQDGSYRYEINKDFKGPFGQVDEFTYYVKTELGNTASAKLNISIDNKVVEVKQSEINDTVIINPLPEIKDITGEVPKLTNVKVLDVSLLDPVIKAGAVDLSSFMNFKVNENNVREMTFQGDGGGVSLTSYSLFVYKFNADTNEYVQVHSINNWYTVILGGKSKEVTLKFTEGDYYAVTVPTGLNVLGGSGLYVNKDTLYDYSTVKTDNDFVGQTSGQIELANGSEIIIAGNTQLVEESELQGVYGKLILNKDGTYQYFVNKPSEGTSLPYGEIETFTYVIKDQNGNSSLETLTIKIDLAVAQDDFEESEIVMQNKSETIVNDTILDIGLAQRTIDAKFAIAENSVSTVAISFESTLSLTSSRSISYTVKNADGTVVKTGELNAVTGKVLQLNDLPAGVYTVQANLVNPGLAYFKDSTITFNTTYLNEFTPVALDPVIGNVSNNDEGLNSISSYTINGLTTSTYSGNPSVTVEGKFGTLVFNNDGSYTYSPSGKGFGKEEFSYTVSTVGGTTSTATLSFDVNKSFTSSKFNDAFTGSDIADKLIFNLLDEADATGGNGFDTWSDFEAGVDVIDVSQLFVDANTSTTFSTDSTDQVADILSKYITVKDSVISIDRDGEGTQFEATQLLNIGPQNADLTLEQLLQNGQIIY